ncbi:hypothetical protein KAR91_47910 [Candidatus Pacearchaeota archaeon]|nr:hypothetical protein [Candidatus Pacearchaeota archaeon]
MSKEKDKSVNIDRTKYNASRSASGSKSLSNGDEVATALEGLTIDDLFSIGDSLLGEDFRSRYASLNTGMQRMNMGNRIRNKVKQIDAEDNAKIGIDALMKVAKPFIKERDANIKATEKEKADKAKEAEAKKAAAEKEKAAKKATREKEAATRKADKEKEKATNKATREKEKATRDKEKAKEAEAKAKAKAKKEKAKK